ncbi:MAG: TRAP transporter substrate-binding protein [Lachnospiraceae bacterium]|nr:TRAP transporter substrate-binding protein [Lachnospiraceae bacterium]
MKKKIAMLLAMVMVTASIVGCGSSAGADTTTTAPETKETEAAAETPAAETTAAEAEGTAAATSGDATYTYNVDNVTEHTFSLSTTATSGSALADVTHYFADRVNELSGGKMTVDVFEGSTLGSEAQNLEALTAGTLDMAIIAVEFYVNSIPQLGALILPYVYDDYDQVQKVLESEAGDYASQQLTDVAKVKALGYYVMAFRNMYTTKPINTVEDLKGFKMRVPESSLYVDTFKMMGAAPTPLASGEVYTALDTGVVEGVENTPDTCLHNSWFEVAPYFNQTNHLNAPTTFSMSDKVFQSLNEDEQNLLLQAGLDASHYGLESTKTSDAEYREELKAKGMEFIESDVESMRAAIDYNAYEFMQSDEAKKLFDLVQANK